MLVASMKAAAKVVMLSLYSTSKDCAKHARVRAGPPLSKASTGVEKFISFLCKQWCLWSVTVVVQCCGLSMVSGVWYLSHLLSVLAELIVCSMRELTCMHRS